MDGSAMTVNLKLFALVSFLRKKISVLIHKIELYELCGMSGEVVKSLDKTRK